MVSNLVHIVSLRVVVWWRYGAVCYQLGCLCPICIKTSHMFPLPQSQTICISQPFLLESSLDFIFANYFVLFLLFSLPMPYVCILYLLLFSQCCKRPILCIAPIVPRPFCFDLIGHPLQRNWFKRKRNADRWMMKWNAACKNSTWTSRHHHRNPLACLHVSIATFVYFSVVATFRSRNLKSQKVYDNISRLNALFLLLFVYLCLFPKKERGRDFFRI